MSDPYRTKAEIDPAFGALKDPVNMEAAKQAVRILESEPMRRFVSCAISPDGYEQLLQFAKQGIPK